MRFYFLISSLLLFSRSVLAISCAELIIEVEGQEASADRDFVEYALTRFDESEPAGEDVDSFLGEFEFDEAPGGQNDSEKSDDPAGDEQADSAATPSLDNLNGDLDRREARAPEASIDPKSPTPDFAVKPADDLGDERERFQIALDEESDEEEEAPLPISNSSVLRETRPQVFSTTSGSTSFRENQFRNAALEGASSISRGSQSGLELKDSSSSPQDRREASDSNSDSTENQEMTKSSASASSVTQGQPRVSTTQSSPQVYSATGESGFTGSSPEPRQGDRALGLAESNEPHDNADNSAEQSTDSATQSANTAEERGYNSSSESKGSTADIEAQNTTSAFTSTNQTTLAASEQDSTEIQMSPEDLQDPFMRAAFGAMVDPEDLTNSFDTEFRATRDEGDPSQQTSGGILVGEIDLEGLQREIDASLDTTQSPEPSEEDSTPRAEPVPSLLYILPERTRPRTRESIP